jgi:ketosteroid isomerase-like protein
MHPHAELIERFYSSLKNRDYAGIAACYHPDVVYSDPVFTHLTGTEVPTMWQMLSERSKDLTIAWRDIAADDRTGTAFWEARYTFSATGRPVHNQINSAFVFEDGLIIAHHDSFDLWKWARMALGQKGVWLGRFPPVQNAIRKNADQILRMFIERRLQE